jgi:hypothetical protein
MATDKQDGGVEDGYARLARLDEEIYEPTYAAVADWMRASPLPHISYDCWARGNYTRHLLWQRRSAAAPIHIAVSTKAEILAAYRRVALLGLPVNFIYTGPLHHPGNVLHLFPSGMRYDAGWGYIAWPHAPKKIRGRKWNIVTGYAQPMPEEIVTVLAQDLRGPFLRGEVFIAPAELIGFASEAIETGIDLTSEITDGDTTKADAAAAQFLVELDLPHVDGLSLRAIERLRRDYDPELAVFRSALRNVTNSIKREGQAPHALVQAVRDNIAELRRSAKYAAFSRDVVKLGGILTTFSASLGALMRQPDNLTLSALGFAGVSAAGIALLDLIKQARETRKKMADNPFFPLWHLGLRHEKQVQRRARIQIRTQSPPSPELIPLTHHWLCPPTGGFLIAGVRKKVSVQ